MLTLRELPLDKRYPGIIVQTAFWHGIIQTEVCDMLTYPRSFPLNVCWGLLAIKQGFPCGWKCRVLKQPPTRDAVFL